MTLINPVKQTGIAKFGTGYLMPGAVLFVLLLCLPVITLLVLALGGTLDSFRHIATTVLPSAGLTTIVLMIGVGLMTALIGTLSAWLITFFDFPFKHLLKWALMLPLAVPTYISAYTFVEFFSYTGSMQELVRTLGGYTSARDYWFPDIRSLAGTIFVLGIVLYPYVYLSVRALFMLQGSSIPDSARILGAGHIRLFIRITLPLARPAIILGVSLAMMETINDIGAVEYLGTRTLTFSVFSVWLNQSDLAGAAQIAIFLLLLVAILVFIENLSRGARRYHKTRTSSEQGFNPRRLKGATALVATVSCFLPVLIGFGIPVLILSEFAIKDIDQLLSPSLLEAIATTVLLGLVAASLAVLGGLLLSLALRAKPGRMNILMVRLASLGYAVPGTLIAIGVFIPLAAFDNALDGILRQTVGISTGLLLTGSGTALIFAYIVRFMAMAEGSLENGLSKISPNLDMAARSLGRSRFKVVTQVLLPMMRPAIASAALLVFVDVVKELSATILLRPFGMNTLATNVYDFASQGRVEDGALACLIIICIGILPVVLLSRNKSG
jgi:iron(III) transport system permease protein